MSLLSPIRAISNSVTTVAPRLVGLLLLCLLATAGCAQDPAPQNSQQSPAPPSTAPTDATLKSQLTPLPQAPAPQHNAHPYADQDYSRGKRQWPNPFVIYTTRAGGPLNVANSPMVDQLLKDGKMYLSINDAVAMALENNLDIGIQRYNLAIADTDILRTSSGCGSPGRQRRIGARHARRHHGHDFGRRHRNLDHRIDWRRRWRHHHRCGRSRRGRGRYRFLHPGRRSPARQLRSRHYRDHVDRSVPSLRSPIPSLPVPMN